jgi:hypothetical protein
MAVESESNVKLLSWLQKHVYYKFKWREVFIFIFISEIRTSLHKAF